MRVMSLKIRIYTHMTFQSQSDLSSALPELGHLLHNVCLFDTDSPVLFFEGHAWNDDNWDGGTTIEVSLSASLIRITFSNE